jgi:hypothetical protein
VLASIGLFRAEQLPENGLSSFAGIAADIAPTMDLIDFIQWPAMAVTLLAAWLVGFERKMHRRLGFWIFVLSNALWIVWGWHDGAYALVALQVGLFALNVYNIRKNQPGPRPAA